MAMDASPGREPGGARLRALNDRPVRPDGKFVLYWMTAFRRTGWNHALDRAVALSLETRRPLVILEGLNADYRWSSPRMHRFVMDGMASNARHAGRSPAFYYPYVEGSVGAGSGLLRELAGLAVAVVADDWPGFFQPGLLERASRLPCRAEAVDSCGLLPVRVAGRAFPSAYGFRRFLQAALPPHLGALPDPDPLRRLPARIRAQVPAAVLNRWPPATGTLLDGGLPSLAYAHAVAPGPLRGGEAEGAERLQRFVDVRLSRYYEDRNAPDADAASGLSPYLHFGHVSPFQILARLAEHEDWAPDRLASQGRGQREGWWGMSRSAEAFLDELVTWRELGLNAAIYLPDYESFRSLPEWSRRTLSEHAADPRPYVYDLDALDEGRTHDALWNAAQRQLREEGVIQSYLRMVWGKKILEWSPGPEVAAEVMIELNNRYALDGRDPNSYSGVFWCLGRYDRPWGPERPIFGKVRYMSTANTARKLALSEYLARYG